MISGLKLGSSHWLREKRNRFGFLNHDGLEVQAVPQNHLQTNHLKMIGRSVNVDRPHTKPKTDPRINSDSSRPDFRKFLVQLGEGNVDNRNIQRTNGPRNALELRIQMRRRELVRFFDYKMRSVQLDLEFVFDLTKNLGKPPKRNNFRHSVK
jgi:hypothetical protein